MVRRIIPTDPHVAASHCDNVVVNSRYTLYSFIPLNLYEQFRRPLNLYFLFVASLQFISIIAPVNPLSTLLPLLFAFTLTAAKEGYDDLKRHRQDHAYNHKRFDVLRGCAWIGVDSQDIRVGDIVRLRRDDEIPCDCVALAAPKEAHGIVYVRTDNMDGEIDLKSRDVVPLQLATIPHQQSNNDFSMQLVDHGQLFSVDADPRDIEYAASKFIFECPTPIPSLDAFDARVSYRSNAAGGLNDTITPTVSAVSNDRLITEKTSDNILTSDGVSLSAAHLLPQSCFLKGVDEVVVMVVYTGNETKCGMSKKPQPIKWAKIDRDVSRYSKFIFICQLVTAGVLGISGFIVSVTTKNTYWYIKYPDSVGTASSFFIYPLRFFLLTTVMIPISFKFVVDMSKYYMALVVGWDLSMWDEEREMGAVVNNSSIVEDLGQIEYILSDKTGTMTRNEMVLKLCSINGTIVGVQRPEDVRLVVRQMNRPHADGREPVASDAAHEEYSLAHLNQLQKQLPEDASRWFWSVLALCNTVEVTTKITSDGATAYSYAATSPDEEALCAAAALRRVTLTHRSRSDAILSIVTANGSTVREDYVLHQVFPFSSEKKCMSVIIESKVTGKIHLIAKGADDKMLERLVGGASGAPKAKAEEHLRAFAYGGLRTLIVCMKVMSKEELQQFKSRYAAALLQLQDRAARLDAIRDEVECNFDILLGATAIEDRLQDHVVQTISDFLDANIKIWMLTGDKIETANQIAISCGLMDSQDNVFRVYGDGWQGRLMSFPVPPKYVRPKKGVVVDNPSYVTIVQGGRVLDEILSTPSLLAHFVAVAGNCKSVVCARVSPIQKAHVTAMVRSQGKLTLAIGDGGNDVAMIQEAHVGVGIVGKEGRQASRAADFAISRFHHLRTLLFIHGHQSYMRTAYVVQYSFYKSMLISFIQLIFNMMVTLMSGVSFWDSFALTAWNGLYTLPQVVFYVFDRALPRIVLEENPFLYRLSQRGYGMTMKGFFGFVLRGVLQSVAVLMLTFGIFDDKYRSSTGNTEGAFINFTVAYTALIFLQVFTVIVESHSITPPNAIAIFGMAALYFMISSIYAEIPGLQYYGVFHHSLDASCLAAAVFIALVLFVPRFIQVGIQKCFYPTAADALRVYEVQRQADIGYKMGLSKKTHLTARNFVSQMILGVEILLRTTITQEAKAEVIQHNERLQKELDDEDI